MVHQNHAVMILPTLTKDHRTVCVMGKSANGKTTLANLLAQKYPRYVLYHTDDYIRYGFKQALYVMMADIAQDRTPYKIIEGVQVTRLLRKWMEIGEPGADLILDAYCSDEERWERYNIRGELDKKAQLISYFDPMLETIWKSIDHSKLPPIVRVCTDNHRTINPSENGYNKAEV